jgi:hypothetical protein
MLNLYVKKLLFGVSGTSHHLPPGFRGGLRYRLGFEFRCRLGNFGTRFFKIVNTRRQRV